MSGDVDSLRDRCDQAVLRVYKIVHLDTMIADPSDYDVIEWIKEDALEALDLPDDLEDEELEDALCFKNGWLVGANTPNRSTWPVFSWSWYSTKVFFASTYDGAIDAAIAWAEDMTANAERQGGKS